MKRNAVIGASSATTTTVVGIDGREYRSECGDRFTWIPPHEKALEKRLARH